VGAVAVGAADFMAGDGAGIDPAAAFGAEGAAGTAVEAPDESGVPDTGPDFDGVGTDVLGAPNIEPRPVWRM